MNDSKVGTKEAIALILTISITHTILSVPRNSILLNLAFVSLVLLGVIFIVVKLFKNFPRIRYIRYF